MKRFLALSILFSSLALGQSHRSISDIAGLLDSLADRPRLATVQALIAGVQSGSIDSTIWAKKWWTANQYAPILTPIDSSAFTTTATRKAIYIPGCRQSWQFGLAIRKNGLPVAGDVMSYWTKTDTLIWFRAAGTTSGLMFNYWRTK